MRFQVQSLVLTESGNRTQVQSLYVSYYRDPFLTVGLSQIHPDHLLVGHLLPSSMEPVVDAPSDESTDHVHELMHPALV